MNEQAAIDYLVSLGADSRITDIELLHEQCQFETDSGCCGEGFIVAIRNDYIATVIDEDGITWRGPIDYVQFES